MSEEEVLRLKVCSTLKYKAGIFKFVQFEERFLQKSYVFLTD